MFILEARRKEDLKGTVIEGDGFTDHNIAEAEEKLTRFAEQSGKPNKPEACADDLCDQSRIIIYRMHRVTVKQLSRVASLFARVAEKIDAWPLEKTEPQAGDLIRTLASHIRRRSGLLKRYIEPYVDD